MGMYAVGPCSSILAAAVARFLIPIALNHLADVSDRWRWSPTHLSYLPTYLLVPYNHCLSFYHHLSIPLFLVVRNPPT